jgi:hypothetical protein
VTTEVLGCVSMRTLERHLTEERMLPYRRATGSVVDAARLYQWNLLVSAALHEVLGILEVALRNGMDRQLQHRHTEARLAGDWWDDPARLLEDRRRDDVRTARARVRRQPVTHGRILAELGFGFWRYLLSSRYEATLWTPALRHAFPYLRPAARDRVYGPVDRLHRLRNRIAHHEPVHALDLGAYEADVVFVAGCMGAELAGWVRGTSRLAGLLAVRPDRPESGRPAGVSGSGGGGA